MLELPFQFHLYGFFVGIGAVIAVSISEHFLKKEKISLNFNLLAMTVILSSLIGARVYHVLTDWQLYQQASFFDFIAVWNGGIGIIGALIGGFIGILVFLTFYHQLKYLLHILDILALSLPFAQSVGRWGNYFNEELYGTVTGLPWGISISKEHLPTFLDSTQKYHPLFLYESVLVFLLGVILHWMYRHRDIFGQLGTGKYLGLYAFAYGCIRFFLEFLRIGSSRSEFFPVNILTTAQWMMLGLAIIGVVILFKTRLSEKIYAIK